MAEKWSFIWKKIQFQGKKSNFKLFAVIEFPLKRTKKACFTFWTSTPRSRHLKKPRYIRITSSSYTNRGHQSSSNQKPPLA